MHIITKLVALSDDHQRIFTQKGDFRLILVLVHAHKYGKKTPLVQFIEVGPYLMFTTPRKLLYVSRWHNR